MLYNRVHSFAEFHHTVDHYRAQSRWIFRGQADASWTLIPKAGRPPYNNLSDHHAYNYWRFSAVEHHNDPSANEWDWLALAQHHGLATRLLDWTYNPLVAAFFSVREDCHGDAAVYALRSKRHLDIDVGDPFELEGIGWFTPKRTDPRISHQAGAFTLHGPPTLPLAEGKHPEYELVKITIDKKYRTDLLRELEHLYVHEAFLFPDLDGLSSYVNWKWSKRNRWVDE